jgi:hypothetical protein
VRPAPEPRWRHRQGADQGWFPCSLVDRSTEEAPDSAPATSPWLPRSTSPRPPSVPLTCQGVPRLRDEGDGCASPPAQIHQVRAGASFERRRTSVSRVCLSATLATPASSGSTDTPWLCRGRLPPIPAPPGTGCPQLHRPAATGRRRRSLTSTQSTSASRRTGGRTQVISTQWMAASWCC